MKINNTTLAIAGILSLAATSSAFAAISANNTSNPGAELTISSNPAVTIKPSKNVMIRYDGIGTSGSGSAAYGISASHSSGTKKYISSSGDTKIYMQDGTALSAVTLNSGNSLDAAAYTAL